MSRQVSRIMMTLSVVLAMVLSLSPAMGDIAPNPGPPKPKPPINATRVVELPLTIKLQKDDQSIKLAVPASTLAAGEAGEGDVEMAATGGANNKMIIAAMFFSLAALAGGMWAVRSRNRSGAAAVATVLVLGALGWWVSETSANRAPPPPSQDPVPLEQKGLLIRLESTAKGKTAVLHISEKQLKLINEQFNEQKESDNAKAKP